MRLHKGNKGISLLELIISIAIAAIVFSIVILFINVASKNFRITNDEVNLQMEAQTAITQISTLVMEASSIDEAETSLEVRYFVDGLDCYYAIVYDKNLKKLYLIQADTRSEVESIVPSQEQHLLADYVDSISITMEKKAARIDITFAIDEVKPYRVTKKVKLRNAN